MSDGVTPDDVLKHEQPTKSYLCKLTDNEYGVEFLEFKVLRNFFHVNKPADEPPMDYAAIPPEHEDAYRTINYQFPTDFLKCKTMRTALVFRVGTQEVNNFRMIERHYFKNKLIRSYDFEFGFCIPNSTNSWEAIYPIPERSAEEIAEFKNSPDGHRSDSFYFVGDKLIMHNKAMYNYADDA
ncbi:protein unc-119 [Pycnococcus provasolii]